MHRRFTVDSRRPTLHPDALSDLAALLQRLGRIAVPTLRMGVRQRRAFMGVVERGEVTELCSGGSDLVRDRW